MFIIIINNQKAIVNEPYHQHFCYMINTNSMLFVHGLIGNCIYKCFNEMLNVFNVIFPDS